MKQKQINNLWNSFLKMSELVGYHQALAWIGFYNKEDEKTVLKMAISKGILK